MGPCLGRLGILTHPRDTSCHPHAVPEGRLALTQFPYSSHHDEASQSHNTVGKTHLNHHIASAKPLPGLSPWQLTFPPSRGQRLTSCATQLCCLLVACGMKEQLGVAGSPAPGARQGWPQTPSCHRDSNVCPSAPHLLPAGPRGPARLPPQGPAVHPLGWAAVAKAGTAGAARSYP